MKTVLTSTQETCQTIVVHLMTSSLIISRNLEIWAQQSTKQTNTASLTEGSRIHQMYLPALKPSCAALSSSTSKSWTMITNSTLKTWIIYCLVEHINCIMVTFLKTIIRPVKWRSLRLEELLVGDTHRNNFLQNLLKPNAIAKRVCPTDPCPLADAANSWRVFMKNWNQNFAHPKAAINHLPLSLYSPSTNFNTSPLL